ncbi:enoyl-CoA hydratase/isomerase family protein [Novosphingobium cyanobacteriorum]|uniref:Enoyl-CoA hydratase/isomerase family protein n=1 Tax=Novosphingobium cyanobacteriorum TaxID=3024215 RepID=A0ABT6CLL1_9SPHN|nr:enoyl-CoA hydratase/isomerase family protein [Novosphingobium cyanobacteriorum]MDF8334810.1 enoyl-CoA hydratase/isomerase family protein [Novosphingobium cyanobacteriorum]
MIAISIDGPIATIAFDSPRTRNALNMAGWRALADAVEHVAASDARALVLRSATAGMFCSGSDLKEIAALADHPDRRVPFRQAMRAAMEPLASLPIATVAVVEGDCFGAGVALALACDMRVAAPGAVFAVTPAKLGITYPQEDVARLVALVGRGQAARLLYGAGPVDAAEAARIGLAEIVAEDPMAAALAWARAAASNAPGSVASLKAMVQADYCDEAFDEAFDSAFAGAHFREGLVAFRDRRRPVFT